MSFFDQSNLAIGYGFNYGHTPSRSGREAELAVNVFLGLMYADGEAMRSGGASYYGGIGLGLNWIDEADYSLPMRIGYRSKIGLTAYAELAPTLVSVGEDVLDIPFSFQLGIGWTFTIYD